MISRSKGKVETKFILSLAEQSRNPFRWLDLFLKNSILLSVVEGRFRTLLSSFIVVPYRIEQIDWQSDRQAKEREIRRKREKETRQSPVHEFNKCRNLCQRVLFSLVGDHFSLLSWEVNRKKWNRQRTTTISRESLLKMNLFLIRSEGWWWPVLCVCSLVRLLLLILSE